MSSAAEEPTETEEDIDDLDHCLRLVEAYDNVWLEISALGLGGEVDRSASYAVALEAILARGLSGRTLYGSDGPQFPGFTKRYLDTTVEMLDTLGFETEQARAILSGNFSTLFGLDEVRL